MNTLSCPLPPIEDDRILLAHGEGARCTRRLIRDHILKEFDNPYLRPLADGAVIPGDSSDLVVTTDSFVVSPLFFPGGDIGSLAVHGTLNDLAVMGADPLALTLSLILEEGLPLETLRRVLRSVAEAAGAACVPVVTGDTKVVPRGAVDKLFVNTTGIGRRRTRLRLGAEFVRPDDALLISGTIGDHGLAILSARASLELDPPIESDSANLLGLVRLLLDANVDVRFLRDPTRGGVSAVLHELCEATGLTIEIEEKSLPLQEGVRGACEILGLDPLHIANEGKLLAVVSGEQAERAVLLMKQHPLGTRASLIGLVKDSAPPQVRVRGMLNRTRVLDEPNGAPLPRIC